MSFYSSQQLSKQGPLRHLWTAAHLERQLKRPQIDATSITSAVEQLLSTLSADVPLALRLNGQLLFGLVRIYRKKLDYLQHDCQAVLERVIAGGSGSAAAAAAVGMLQRQGISSVLNHGGVDGSQHGVVPSTAAAAAVKNGKTASGGAAAGSSSRPLTLDIDGVGFDTYMDDGLGLDLEDPTWGSQGFNDALKGSGLGRLSQRGSGGSQLRQESVVPVHMGGSQGLGGRLVGLAASDSLGFYNGLDDELFDAHGEDASVFDLTELEAQALRTVSGAATAAAATADEVAAATATGGEQHSCHTPPEPDSNMQQQQTPQQQQYFEELQSPERRPAASELQGSADLDDAHLPFPEVEVSAAAGTAAAAAAAAGTTAVAAAAAGSATAVVAPKQQTSSKCGSLRVLFGGLSKMKVDNNTSRHRIPTELPGGDIRALLADRSPLIDSSRFAGAPHTATTASASAAAAASGGGGVFWAGQQLELCYNALLLGSVSEARSAAAAVNAGCYSCSGNVDRAAAAVLSQAIQRIASSSSSSQYTITRLCITLSSSMIAAAALAAAASAGFDRVQGSARFKSNQERSLNLIVLGSQGLGCGGPVGCFSADLAKTLVNGACALAAAAAPAAAAAAAASQQPDDQPQQQESRLHSADSIDDDQQQQHEGSSEKVIFDQFDQPQAERQEFDRDISLLSLEQDTTHDASSQQQQSDETQGEASEELTTGGHEAEGTETATAAAAAADPPAGAKDAPMGFTNTTRKVLEQLNLVCVAESNSSNLAEAAVAAGVVSSKRKQPDSQLAAAAAGPTVWFRSLLEHNGTGTRKGARAAKGCTSAAAAAGCSRLDASRTFYEMLVLQNRGYVALQQQIAYGDLLILPKHKLLEEVQDTQQQQQQRRRRG